MIGVEITKMYAIYDSKAEGYLLPIFCKTPGVALRRFSEALTDPKHDFCRWPADYTLFEVGTFNHDNGLVTANEQRVNLGNGLEIKSQLESEAREGLEAPTAPLTEAQ